ncbi:MAG TPA: DUF488 family protein [Coriobacteriia bacterium]
MGVRVKRVYEEPSAQDGYRVLVDRLWPRGLTKERARVDLWLRDIAPSTDLRQWYGHDEAKWPAFSERYRGELERHGELLDLLQDLDREHRTLTLLFAARDEAHNEADVLAEVLQRRPAHSHR